MKKLYVGNLPYSVTEETLTGLFSQFGDVESVVLIKDRETGRLKGFGFVEFAKQADAENALSLNGKDFEGRPLKISMAQPKESTGGSRSGGGSWGGGRR